VPDHKVSLNIQSLPLYALDTIIKKMALKNSAVVYDDALQMMSVYVLPEGLDISKVVSGGTIIRSADFAVEKEVSTIKGKNKLPIRYVKYELLIKFHLGVTEKEIDSILQEYCLKRIPNAALSKIGYVKVKVPRDKDAIETAKAIRKDYRVKVPEPNYIANILTPSFRKNAKKRHFLSIFYGTTKYFISKINILQAVFTQFFNVVPYG